MALKKQNKTRVKKVIKGLNKASKLHAGQAKSLKKVVGMSRGGSTVNKAGNYTKPGMRKALFKPLITFLTLVLFCFVKAMLLRLTITLWSTMFI